MASPLAAAFGVAQMMRDAAGEQWKDFETEAPLSPLHMYAGSPSLRCEFRVGRLLVLQSGRPNSQCPAAPLHTEPLNLQLPRYSTPHVHLASVAEVRAKLMARRHRYRLMDTPSALRLLTTSSTRCCGSSPAKKFTLAVY